MAVAFSQLRTRVGAWFARWLRRAADRLAPSDQPAPAEGPPADWLQRVRKGAPGLLLPRDRGGIPVQFATPLPNLPHAIAEATPASATVASKSLETASPGPPTQPPASAASFPAAADTASKPRPPAPPHPAVAAPRIRPVPREPVAAPAERRPSASPAPMAAPRRKTPPIRLTPIAAAAAVPLPAANSLARQTPWPRLPQSSDASRSASPRLAAHAPSPEPVGRREVRRGIPDSAELSSASPKASGGNAGVEPSRVITSTFSTEIVAQARQAMLPPAESRPRPLEAPAPGCEEEVSMEPAAPRWPELPDPPEEAEREWAEVWNRSERDRLALAEQKGELPSNA